MKDSQIQLVLAVVVVSQAVGAPLVAPYDTKPYTSDTLGNAGANFQGHFRRDGGPEQYRYFIGTNPSPGPGELILDFAVSFTDGPEFDLAVVTSSQTWGDSADVAKFELFLDDELVGSWQASLRPDAIIELELPGEGIVANRVVIRNLTPDPPGIDDRGTMTFDDAGVAHPISREPVPIQFQEVAAGFRGVRSGAMAWGDFDNDDYLDLVVTGDPGDANGRGVMILYRNRGDLTFEATDYSFDTYRHGSVSWGDVDNDGYLDLLVSGLTADATRVYRNVSGTGFVEYARSPLSYDGRVAWGDLNNDGLLDYALVGANSYSRLYRNEGGGAFTELSTVIASLYYGSVGWGDYDKDGFTDLLLTGTGTSGQGGAFIYRNEAELGFREIWRVPFAEEPGQWVELNNDGWLDLVVQQWSTQSTSLYRNNRAGGFQLMKTFPLGPVAAGDFNADGLIDLLIGQQVFQNSLLNDWLPAVTPIPGPGAATAAQSFPGDFDKDGRLDLVLSDSSYVSHLLRNITAATNTPPTAPTGMAVDSTSRQAWLSWSEATDAEQRGGLTYNVRIGSTPGGIDIVSPMSSAAGFRRIVREGNSGTRTNFLIQGLVAGQRYYWSVQAVDNSFAGSAFSEEHSFDAVDPIGIGVGASPSHIDLQTGLFYQMLTVTNMRSRSLAGLLISVRNLPADVMLVAATGADVTNGLPVIEYAFPVAADESVALTLAYYSSSRTSPVGIEVLVEELVTEGPGLVSGESVSIRRAFLRSDGFMLVEFDSQVGSTYAVEYSDDLASWKPAAARLTGNGSLLVWIDTGPPVTESPPSAGRFYRVLLLTP